MASESGPGAMIDITVKTLDGQNRTFNVPEHLTVRQFKEKISSSIEISADTQRLIFQGRVMQDEKTLKDYDIHGKVIHLVQRAPPTTLSGASNTSSTPTSTPSHGRHHGPMNGNHFDVQIHLGRVQGPPNSREARNRLRQADFNLTLIHDVLSLMETRTGFRPDRDESLRGQQTARPSSAPASTERQSEDTMDTSSPPESGTATQTEGSAPQTEGSAQQATPQQSTNDDQQGVLMATELADFLDRVLSANHRMEPHIRLLRDCLRNEQSYGSGSRESRDSQEVVSRVTEVLHAVSHMMHSLSELVVDMSTETPRQVVAAPPMPFPLPGPNSMAIPIHMNVRTRHNGGTRQSQTASSTAPTATSGTTTATATTAAGSSESTPSGASNTTNTATPTASSGHGPFQMPPVSLPASLDPSVMVEVFPTGVTVHDVRAVVTQGPGDDDSDSSSDSDAGLTRNTANITIRSSATVEHPVTSTTASTASSAATTTSASATTTTPSAPPPQTSTPRTPGMPVFSSSRSSSSTTTSTFTFGPAAGGLGPMPSVPGLPPGMLQNILGSILNSHGMRPGHPVQVNVVQQFSSPGGGGPRLHFSSHNERTHQQPIHDLPLDSDRGPPAPAGTDASQQTQGTVDAETETRQNASTNTTASSNNAATNTDVNSTNAATNTSNSSTNAATNTTSSGNTSTASSSPTYTSTINIDRNRPGSSVGTGTDPNIGTNSRSTNTPRPHFHIHHRPQGPQSTPTRPQGQRPIRTTAPGGIGRGYVDPYLACLSPHYTTQTALANYRAVQIQAQQRGQPIPQPPQQQVPNLSTMVSGMVGDIIEQVGQAAQQALNSGTGPTTNSSTSTSTTTVVSGGTTRTTTTTTSRSSSGSSTPPPFNPMEMFSSMFSGERGGGGGSVSMPSMPFDIGAMISNMMQGGRGAEAPSNTSSGTTSAPPPPPPPSSRGQGTLADLFTHFRHAAEAGDGDGTDVNVIVSLLEAVAPHMGLTDLFSLVMGNTRVLSQLRGPLREFVNSRVSQHGSVNQVVEVALSDMFPEIQHIESLVEVREGVDMARSIRNCLQTHLRTIFTAINSDGPGSQEEFGRNLYTLWMTMMAETIGLCIYCIRDGQAGFSNMVQRYMPRMTQGMNPAITIWMTTSLQDILGSFHHNHPVQESDILRYVVNRPARSVEASSVSASEQATAAISKKVTRPTSQAASTTPGPATNRSPPAPMEVNDSPSSQPPKAKVARTVPEDASEANDIFEDAQETLVTPQAVASPPPSTITTRSPGRRQGGVGGSGDLRNGRSPDDWQSVIPQEWIPVINRDIVRQQEQRPQPPPSDAYLQGLPAKRRRMMTLEHAGEMGNMPQYLPASLTRAARAAGVEPVSSEENMTREAMDNIDLQADLEQEVTSVLEARISSDRDFSSERFPNAKEYFRKSKRH